MPSTAFDSFYLKDRFGSAAMRALWNDRAMIQTWLDVEAALALAEAELGVIPRKAGREIAAAAQVDRLDLRRMKRDFDRTWNPVVPLVDALRAVVSRGAAGYVHWGATSKNVFDTGTALQVKASHALLLQGLDRVAARTARLARRHRDTLMAGRTHGQNAAPITFGYKAAVWLDELMRQRQRLEACAPRSLVGELGGAVGTLAALGPKGIEVQRRVMKRLGLGVPRVPTKTAGDRFAEFFLNVLLLSATLGKIAQNVYNLQQSGVDEVAEASEGKIGSSAMPHKKNPVVSGSIVFLGRLARARAGSVFDYVHAEGEDDHRQGETAWSFAPEICLLVDAQLALCDALLRTLSVKPRAMLANLDRGGGALCSEPLLMALAPRMGRDRAHAHVLRLCREADASGTSLRARAEADREVARALTANERAQVFDYRRAVGLAPRFVDDVLRTYARTRRPLTRR